MSNPGDKKMDEELLKLIDELWEALYGDEENE